MFIGYIAIVWFVVWWTCIAETPARDKHITKAELKYIVDSLGPTDDTKSTILFYWSYHNIINYYLSQILTPFLVVIIFFSKCIQLSLERHIYIDAGMGNKLRPFFWKLGNLYLTYPITDLHKWQVYPPRYYNNYLKPEGFYFFLNWKPYLCIILIYLRHYETGHGKRKFTVGYAVHHNDHHPSVCWFLRRLAQETQLVH